MKELLEPCFDIHNNGANRSIEWRREQLHLMQRLMAENKAAILAALQKDMGKPPGEAYFSEILLVENEIDALLRGLPQWLKRQYVASPGMLAPATSYYEYEPLRAPANLIIGPFNYPFQLAMLPAVGSLAAGNPTVVKPSEMCPATSRLMKELADKYFTNKALQVVEGGVDVTTQLLQQKWGTILFTGSRRVGEIVAGAAAKTLTPTILELGGKSPVYVHKDCKDLQAAANRILWGKTINSGQTCVAPDFVLCHADVFEEFCDLAVQTVERMYPDPANNEGYGRIVNAASVKRLMSYVDEVRDHVIYGGQGDPEKRFMSPTIVKNPPDSAKIWQDELFGPIMPVKSVESMEDAVSVIKDMATKTDTPLAMMVFTSSDDVYAQMRRRCRSGGTLQNDACVHFCSSYLPVGGLGSSGWGAYHGKFSFEAFSHKRAVVCRPGHSVWDYNGIRFAPRDAWKEHAMALVLKLPSIPVLYTRQAIWSLSSILAIGLASRYVDGVDVLLRTVRSLVANNLVAMGHWLKGGADA